MIHIGPCTYMGTSLANLVTHQVPALECVRLYLTTSMPQIPGLFNNLFNNLHYNYLRDCVVERNKGTCDDCDVHEIPEVSEKRTRMQYKAQINHLK